MNTYTSFPVLKTAWEILKEVGLSHLMSGKKDINIQDINILELLDNLLERELLKKFLYAITKGNEKVEDLEIEEVSALVKDFFVRIINSSGVLALQE